MLKRATKIRCFCSRAPLLAVCGLSESGPYVHVKVYKQSRVYGEIVVTNGDVRVRCRECLRWHRIVFSAGGYRHEGEHEEIKLSAAVTAADGANR